eukprot:3136898-Rhodomonas_salina.1
MRFHGLAESGVGSREKVGPWCRTSPCLWRLRPAACAPAGPVHVTGSQVTSRDTAGHVTGYEITSQDAAGHVTGYERSRLRTCQVTSQDTTGHVTGYERSRHRT